MPVRAWAKSARLTAAADVESMQVGVLTGGLGLSPGGPNIQPDAYLHG